MNNNIDDAFVEVGALLKRREYEIAYKKLDSGKLSSNPKARATKAFLNYCEYVQYTPKRQALESLRELSKNNSDHATNLLAKAYMLPGAYESLSVAIPHAFILAKALYEKRNSQGAILYAELLRGQKHYDEAWDVLEEAKSFEKINLATIYSIQKNIINESQNHLDYLPQLFEQCCVQYKKGNKEIYSVYMQFLLNKDSEFFNPALGLQVLEKGIVEDDYVCKLLKASLLASFEWYMKRDLEQAVMILRKLINDDRHEQTARIMLSQIYMSDKKYQTLEYGKEVVQLLAGNIWYSDLQNINLLLAIIVRYNLTDSEYFLDAVKMKAKLEGKYSSLKFRIFGLFLKIIKPIGIIYSSFVLIMSYILAFILASARLLIFYIPNLIRQFFR